MPFTCKESLPWQETTPVCGAHQFDDTAQGEGIFSVQEIDFIRSLFSCFLTSF